MENTEYQNTNGIITNSIVYSLIKIATANVEDTSKVDETSKVNTIVNNINTNLSSVE